MDYSFDECIKNCLVESTKVTYDSSMESRILAYAKQMAEVKIKEEHHKYDCFNEEKRISTGLLGEAALEQILGIDIIDWSIGNSTDYNYPDVPGYRVGIKTVEYGKFPIIFKKNKYPQIICVLKRDENAVYVCGLGTVDILNKYQDDNLILSPRLKARGIKTGFYGFDKLLKIKSIDDLWKYKITKDISKIKPQV